MPYPLQQGEGYPTRFPYGIVEANHYLSGTADGIVLTPGSQNFLVGGTYFITGAAIDAVTLVLPIPGGAWNGTPSSSYPFQSGQDGLQICIQSKTAFAHAVTTPANGINGSKHIATFAAAVGNNIILQADQGVWWMISEIGVTLS